MPTDLLPFGLDPSAFTHVQVARRGVVAVVTLNRPNVHNAFNAQMIAELTSVFLRLGATDEVRAVVLQGAGRNFCAGADLNWMGASITLSHDENVADAVKLSEMLQAINTCRHPVIGRIHGAALAGGTGLAAVCDIAIATDDARFGFTEARLGIAPAVISQFVVPKIGQSHARALFVTAERFDAARALAIGLVHRVVTAAQLDETVTATLRDLAHNGPAGVRAAKFMAESVERLGAVEAREMAAATIAGLRVSAEGQEGIRAFLEGRQPAWMSDDV